MRRRTGPRELFFRLRASMPATSRSRRKRLRLPSQNPVHGLHCRPYLDSQSVEPHSLPPPGPAISTRIDGGYPLGIAGRPQLRRCQSRAAFPVLPGCPPACRSRRQRQLLLRCKPFSYFRRASTVAAISAGAISISLVCQNAGPRTSWLLV